MVAIGTAVLGGMITGTILVVLFAPFFYVLIEKTFGKRKRLIADQRTESEGGVSTI
jgi:HAE1 family hydrophobic/amphiphilic exporter-1